MYIRKPLIIERINSVTKKVVIITIGILGLGFILGWVFPVEGPVDYVYDDYKAQKCAVKNGPLVLDTKKLSEEELNFLEEIYEMMVGDVEE